MTAAQNGAIPVVALAVVLALVAAGACCARCAISTGPHAGSARVSWTRA
ncbi:hypothetical protein ACFQX6_32570 [Streptosporangium lutulentum]